MKQCLRNVGEPPLYYATVNGSLFIWGGGLLCSFSCGSLLVAAVTSHKMVHFITTVLKNLKSNDMTTFRHLIFVCFVNELKSANTRFGGNFRRINFQKKLTACYRALISTFSLVPLSHLPLRRPAPRDVGMILSPVFLQRPRVLGVYFASLKT